jgi:hypothetical protein
MATLTKVDLGWKHLTQVLNDIIGAVNSNKPKAGKGINVNEAGEISLIDKADAGQGTATAQQDTATNTGGSGVGGSGGVSQSALDALTARVAALEALLATTVWTSVDVMSSSCVRSTIKVLTKP